MSGKKELVQVAGYLVHETVKAVLIKPLEDGYPEVWFPISQIKGGIEGVHVVKSGDTEVEVLFLCPLWLAQAKDIPYTEPDEEEEDTHSDSSIKEEIIEAAPDPFDSYDDDVPF